MNLEWFSILRLRLRALMRAPAPGSRPGGGDGSSTSPTAPSSPGWRTQRRHVLEIRPRSRRRAGKCGLSIGWRCCGRTFATPARTLRKSPGFTLVAALTLALGIGANTAIFSVVNAVILRPLPYPEPARLVELFGNVKRAKVERRGTSFADYLDWRPRAGHSRTWRSYAGNSFTLTGFDEPERIPGEFVGAGLLPAARNQPALGRTFRPDEDEVPQRDAVVVLSDGLWKRRFGGDPGVVGRTIPLDGRGYTVIGVMPPWFRGVHRRGRSVDSAA